MADLRSSESLQWFNDLYQQNIPNLYKIALYILQDPVEAEDLCHDVFLEVIQNPEQFDPGRGSVQAWLAVKTKSRAIDRLRKRKQLNLQKLPEPAAVPPVDPTAESVLLKLAKENLHESLKRLPKSQREALAATYFYSFRQREWAAQTGYPLGTVKSLIHYGLRNIRKQFIQMGWLEP